MAIAAAASLAIWSLRGLAPTRNERYGCCSTFAGQRLGFLKKRTISLVSGRIADVVSATLLPEGGSSKISPPLKSSS